MINKRWRKRGESIVEVMVALGVLSFIFMGAVNIIVSSITLNTSARQRLEVVSTVQKQLNEYLINNYEVGACAVTLVNPIAACSPSTVLTKSTDTCFWIEVVPLSDNEKDTDLGLDTNFSKVISHGKWYTRVLGEQSFEISRVVRNR